MEQCRSRIEAPVPIIAVFPDQPPDPQRIKSREVAANWVDLLEKKEDLTVDWTGPDSRSVTPVEDYRDCKHLKQIVLDQVKRVLGGLLNPISPVIPMERPERDSYTGASARSFIDQLTDVTVYDSHAVNRYRKQLRDEARLEFSETLSDAEFLAKAGYMRNGRLTRAGVLLFTRSLDTELPTAKIRCVVYYGTTKEAARDRTDIKGPVYNQITQAYDFVSARVEKMELPTRGSLPASTIYRYPMNCVREIIANAICHRSYDDDQRMTYIRIFPDRIEVCSPGIWGSRKLPEETEIRLRELAGESVSPNSRLAHGIASINIVEMEGSGIPTAVKDCDTVGAPEPVVIEREGYVVVMIFPKADWAESLRRMARDTSKEVRTKGPTIFISYSHRDEVWKDRLMVHLGQLERSGRIVLWDERRVDAGAAWYPEIKQAMDQAAVAVCLISADYLSSDFCVKEEIPYLLERRERDGMALIPVLLRPCLWQAVPWLKPIQMLPRDGKSVSKDFKDDWDTVFAEVAERIFEVLEDPAYQPPTPPPPRWTLPEKVDIGRLPMTGAELFGRQRELELLDDAWESDRTHIVSLVAWGGVGKSTLLNKWLERMAAENYRGARRVYAWSFHSQGTGERVTSADLFFAEALAWFGDPNPTMGFPWDKGQRLAELIRREKTLLLLDGMEPLQSGLDYERGKVKDPALATLLAELARHNPGLCVITTRVAVADLAPFPETTRQENMEQISAEAGRALLRVGGVQGADAELEQAARDFGQHALALNLLAAYLREIPGHFVTNASGIPDLDVSEEAGKHPRRVMAAFATRFGPGPEVGLLRMLGLFDRPAKAEEMAALRAAPPISDLTEHVQPLSEAGWLRLLDKMRQARLVAPQSRHQPDSLDAHPLVREHFGQQLQQEYPEAWREGHNRLYEHLKAAAKEYPDTLEEMAPLYAAVAHGCQAGRHQEVLDEVYWRRIQRGNEFFGTKKLGAIGADLAALSGLFDPPWRRPVAGLTEADKGWVLNYAGFGLRALGRLAEAAQPMQTGLEVRTAQEDWANAARGAGNLSELYLTSGDLAQALDFARQSVDLADRSGDDFVRMAFRTTLADALHQAGSRSEAEAAFREAEEMQKERQPQYPLLYSLQGFHYCDLLLGQGKVREVQSRADQMLEGGKQAGDPLLDISMYHLSLGRAYLLQAQQEGADPSTSLRTSFTQAAAHLNQAVDGLRRAQRQDHIPRGLLARAELRRVMDSLDRSRTDLEEALSIATRGGMRLYEADCHLEYARLHLACGEEEKARQSLAQAKEMIEDMDYHRRDGEVAELEEMLRP